ILDKDLAELYGVPVFRLNEAVKRNRNRFPPDFMFRLTGGEYRVLISQFAMSNPRRGGRRSPPYAFTEQGVAMLSSVLRTERAVAVNIEIMRAFVRLRQLVASNADLRRRLDELERAIGNHDEKFAAVFAAIRELMAEPRPKRKPPVGYHISHRSHTPLTLTQLHRSMNDRAKGGEAKPSKPVRTGMEQPLILSPCHLINPLTMSSCMTLTCTKR